MGEITSLWIFLIEDIKLYIREQSREFESGENGFYLERLNSGSEVRAMRNKSQNGKRWCVQVVEGQLGILLRTQHICCNVLLSPAEARVGCL